MGLVNKQGSMYGKYVTGQYKWEYVREECYWSINRRVCMGRMLLVNKQRSMYGKNVNGQYTWDYGWEECYWEIHMGSWMGKKVLVNKQGYGWEEWH